jgi:hypothetical protein
MFSSPFASHLDIRSSSAVLFLRRRTGSAVSSRLHLLILAFLSLSRFSFRSGFLGPLFSVASLLRFRLQRSRITSLLAAAIPFIAFSSSSANCLDVRSSISVYASSSPDWFSNGFESLFSIYSSIFLSHVVRLLHAALLFVPHVLFPPFGVRALLFLRSTSLVALGDSIYSQSCTYPRRTSVFKKRATVRNRYALPYTVIVLHQLHFICAHRAPCILSLESYSTLLPLNPSNLCLRPR